MTECALNFCLFQPILPRYGAESTTGPTVCRFIGNFIERLLKQGHFVLGFDRFLTFNITGHALGRSLISLQALNSALGRSTRTSKTLPYPVCLVPGPTRITKAAVSSPASNGLASWMPPRWPKLPARRGQGEERRRDEIIVKDEQTPSNQRLFAYELAVTSQAFTSDFADDTLAHHPRRMESAMRKRSANAIKMTIACGHESP